MPMHGCSTRKRQTPLAPHRGGEDPGLPRIRISGDPEPDPEASARGQRRILGQGVCCSGPLTSVRPAWIRRLHSADTVPARLPIACPRCTRALEAVSVGALVLSHCSDCGGWWFDADELSRLRDLAGASASLAVDELVAALDAVPSSGRKVDLTGGVRCPICSSPMHRRNYRGVSGVLLDHCAAHGTWADRGETQRVLGIGHVDDDRYASRRAVLENERRELEERRRRRAVAEISMPTSMSQPLRYSGPSLAPSLSLMAGVADALRELLLYLWGDDGDEVTEINDDAPPR